MQNASKCSSVVVVEVVVVVVVVVEVSVVKRRSKRTYTRSIHTRTLPARKHVSC